ncbi:putative actin binding protein [Talaromyces proteolyticus]|uniref:Actin binding protein n=1 Tax=Talaromyces proteolyticus TaxID=1131652 RepID=A0AAD4KIH2_9EURO|nr:putative actin binding protein [Talaromyces proteolyticus]KAH8689213.1 putative actin binding protein [Talaromyces proteolyticus]
MSSLNLSTNGPSISKSYQSVVSAVPASVAAAASPTYGQWALFNVTTPLVNAFQPDAGNKESVLKVQSSGEGELADLVEDFSEGKIQFAFVKVKDLNTGLPKNVLIGWCGEGVPERTKGYFTSHLAAVSRFFQGYHVQITARSEQDLSPDGILQKVADASGSKYSSNQTVPQAAPSKPPVATKPVFSAGRSGGFVPPPGGRRVAPPRNDPVDADGWGADAPPITRTQLEKVPSAYRPTKVDINQLTSQKQPESRFNQVSSEPRDDVVRGGYQPIGKVDIAAIRRKARESGQNVDDRPTPVKGTYEPVGKVDIGEIRSRAQQPRDAPVPEPPAPEPQTEAKTLSERSAAFQSSERLTSLPKPKVANRVGTSSNFTGTKAPLPSEFGQKPAATAAPVGLASKTFADEGGKTPAQLWAERKAREKGTGAAAPTPSSQPVTTDLSGDGQWRSSYTGKSWAPVQTTHTGRSATSSTSQQFSSTHAQEEEPVTTAVTSERSIEPTPTVPPPLDNSNKPNAGRGVPLPGFSTEPTAPDTQYEEKSKQEVPPPPQQPRSPTPPTPPVRETSPIQVAMPVSRTAPEDLVQDAHEELDAPPQPLPIRSLEQAVPKEEDLEDPAHDTGRATAEAAAHAAANTESIRAVVLYDYEKAEENEIELKEGENVTDIEMVDQDWWLGVNVHGDRGLFPSNYVEVVEQSPGAPEHEEIQPPVEEAEPEAGDAGGHGHTATALYDYEAAEDNELSFPDGAKIVNVEFPDEDWWSGEFNGHVGLFPANYVELDK